MDISNWGEGRLLQLPDFCFGRRYLVSATIETSGNPFSFAISEMGLPETGVLWELLIRAWTTTNTAGYVQMAYGDVLPVSAAVFDVLEPLMAGLGLSEAEPRRIPIRGELDLHLRTLRQLIRPGGKRLCIGGNAGPAGEGAITVGLVVSSFPKDIPEWLSSVLGSDH